MTTHKAGLDIYKNLKLGDSVITIEGKDLSKDPDHVILNHKQAQRQGNGDIIIRGSDLIMGGVISFYLTKEEWKALKAKF